MDDRLFARVAERLVSLGSQLPRQPFDPPHNGRMLAAYITHEDLGEHAILIRYWRRNNFRVRSYLAEKCRTCAGIQRDDANAIHRAYGRRRR